MKRFFIASFAMMIILFTGILNAQAEKFGADLTLNEKTNISKILENPSDFVGKRVLIEGEVTDVCQMAGCWMMIKGENPDQTIRIKVKDGEIVFPVEATGGNAVVEGEVYSIEMDEEEAREYLEHMAEDAGKEFDPASVTGPLTIYQIKGLGAVIDMPVKDAKAKDSEM